MQRTVNANTLRPDQFVDALAELGWKQTDFARRTGVTFNTANAWANGRTPAPQWATAYLDAMLDIARLYRKYAAPLPARATDADDDAATAANTPPPARLAHLLPRNPMS